MECSRLISSLSGKCSGISWGSIRVLGGISLCTTKFYHSEYLLHINALVPQELLSHRCIEKMAALWDLLQKVLKIPSPHFNISLILVACQHFFRNWRNVQSRKSLSQTLPQIVEVVISSSYLYLSILITTWYQVCKVAFCSI